MTLKRTLRKQSKWHGPRVFQVLHHVYPPSGNLTWLLKMAIEIVSFPVKNGDFPQLCKSLPEGNNHGKPRCGTLRICRNFSTVAAASRHPRVWEQSQCVSSRFPALMVSWVRIMQGLMPTDMIRPVLQIHPSFYLVTDSAWRDAEWILAGAGSIGPRSCVVEKWTPRYTDWLCWMGTYWFQGGRIFSTPKKHVKNSNCFRMVPTCIIRN